MAQHLDPVSFSAGTSIISRGEVEVLNREGQNVAVIKHGQCVGEIALLTEALRTADVKARTYCDVYRLTKGAFDLVSKEFPELEENFRRIMDRRTQSKNAA